MIGKSIREYTAEEIQEKFFSQLYVMIKYWERIEQENYKDKLEGLVFSILNILDGGSLGFPRVLLVPYPHPEDKEFHISEGENWFPQNTEVDKLAVGELSCNGQLHEAWVVYKKKREEKNG